MRTTSSSPGSDRRLADADPDPAAQLDEAVGTLIASNLHDEFAQLASNVALREYTRLAPPQRAAIDAKRMEVLDIVEQVVVAGVAPASSRPTHRTRRPARSWRCARRWSNRSRRCSGRWPR